MYVPLPLAVGEGPTTWADYFNQQYRWATGCLSSGLRPCPGCQRGYHTYTVVIDRRDAANQQIRWYLDGNLFFTVAESQVGAGLWTEAVDHSFSIILDLAIGGKYPDSTCHCTAPSPATTSGATMSVQYVRVYRGVPS